MVLDTYSLASEKQFSTPKSPAESQGEKSAAHTLFKARVPLGIILWLYFQGLSFQLCILNSRLIYLLSDT